jgi:hypothetical protein
MLAQDTNRSSAVIGMFALAAAFCFLIQFMPRVHLRAESRNSKLFERTHQPSFEIRSAPLIHFPGGHNSNRKADFFADSNSPSHWDNDNLYVINSWEQPWVSSGPSLLKLNPAVPSKFDDPRMTKLWLWLESTYKDDDGTLYAWYHNEIPNVCPPRTDDLPGYPIVVKIGALRSKDNGEHWENLGFILEPDSKSIYCGTQNQWYAGGPGDFSVVLDSQKKYFYLYFTNYPNDFAEQGLCVARMKYANRNSPRGKVLIWRRSAWSEPGNGGHATPIIPASVDITRKDGVTFWGPSIHWNTYLQQYVMLLNRIKDTTWATEGLYISFNIDVANPSNWTTPKKILDREEAIHVNPAMQGNGWYIQAMGTERGGTDKLAGQIARLFLDGQSRWEIVFSK